MNIKNTAQTLTIEFLTNIKEFEVKNSKIECNANYKISVLKDIEEILNGGLDPKDFMQAFKDFKKQNKKYKEVYDVSELLKSLNIPFNKKVLTRKPDELLESGKFYYHPALQLVPAPPRLIQLDSGEFVYKDEEEFFLEIKESFTLTELVDYYYNKFNIKANVAIINRDKAIMSRLVESYGLDIVLFGIDETYYQMLDRGMRVPNTPYIMQNYLEEINALYDSKKDEAHRKGLNHVITRKIK